MSDFMVFLYAHYIQPYLNEQPRDDADEYRYSLLDPECNEDVKQDVAAVVAYAATHAFLLGLRTGAGLARTCGGPPPTTPGG